MNCFSSRLKVLYLIDTLSVGGAEQSLATIVSRFRNTEVVVCHLYAGDHLKQTLETAGLRVVSLNLSGQYSIGRAIGRVRRLMLDVQPDLVHSTLLRSNLVARFAGNTSGLPVVNSLVNESYAPVRFQRLSATLRRKYQAIQAVDRITARMTYHFVSNSQAIKIANSKALGVPPHKISVIYRGRDPDQFTECSPRDVARLRTELKLNDDSPVLLNVGRLVLAKNQTELIRAMPAVLRTVPKCRLLIAGEGPERPALERTIADLGLADHVRLLGNRADVPDLLKLADVFVFPSLYEGHPGALVEAMFAACPIVASDIPVHRETLLGGAVGELTPLGDPHALADRILAMLHNPAYSRNLGACARESALQRFDIRNIAAQHELLYQSLIKRWRAAH